MPLEIILSYNIIISMICFYQIMIEYQYYAKDYPAPNTKLDDDQEVMNKCYVDALTKDEENIMLIVLITAFVYTFSPCFIVLPIHFCQKHCKKWKIFVIMEV